jgi:predicted  nucleic acid-binding Zn-ribbon protein
MATDSHFEKRRKAWEALHAAVDAWRKKATVLQRENQGLRERVAELEKQAVDAKYRALEGRPAHKR